jgi:hypothetical protein
MIIQKGDLIMSMEQSMTPEEKEKTILFAFRLCTYHLINEAFKNDSGSARTWISSLNVPDISLSGQVVTLAGIVDCFIKNVMPKLPKYIVPSTGELTDDATGELKRNPLNENSESSYGDGKCDFTAECAVFTNRVIEFVKNAGQKKDQRLDPALILSLAFHKIRLFYLIMYNQEHSTFFGNEQISICGSCVPPEGELGTSIVSTRTFFKNFTYHGKDIKSVGKDELKLETPGINNNSSITPIEDVRCRMSADYQARINRSIEDLKKNNEKNERNRKIISLIIAVIIALFSVGACVVGGLLIGKIFNIGLNALASKIVQYGILAVGIIGLAVDAICNFNRIKKSIGGCLCCNSDEKDKDVLPTEPLIKAREI